VWSRPTLGINERLLSQKISRAKRAGGLDHLPSKHEALEFKPYYCSGGEEGAVQAYSFLLQVSLLIFTTERNFYL
jgi:hypothetical protein